MGQIGLMVTLLDPETQTAVMNAAVMANARDHTAATVPQDSHKTKQQWGMSAIPLCSRRRSHTPERCPLLPPPVFHLMPIAVPHRLSSDPTSTNLSFDQSQGLLPPVDLGGGDPFPIPSLHAPI